MIERIFLDQHLDNYVANAVSGWDCYDYAEPIDIEPDQIIIEVVKDEIGTRGPAIRFPRWRHSQ